MTRKALGRGIASLVVDLATADKRVAGHLLQAWRHVERADEILAGRNLAPTPLDHVITQNKGKRT